MRRLFALFFFAFVMGCMVFAGAEKESESVAVKQVSMRFWRAGLDEPTRKFYEKEISKFQEKYPNVKIEYAEHDFSDAMETKLNLGFASGTGPDALRYVISSIAHRASLNQYSNLGPYIEKWSDKDDIVGSSYEIGSYMKKVYGISVQADPMFLIYRKDYFREAGLDANKPPAGWSDIKEYARKLVVREGDRVVRGGFELPTSGQGHHRLIMFGRQNNAKLVDFEKDMPVFNEPALVQALDYLTSFNREKLLIPYRMPQDESPFRQGRTAMVLGSRGDVSRILTIHPDWKDNLGFAEVKGLKDSSFSGAQIYFIPESSRSKDEAWEYIKSLLEKETLWRMYQELGTIPVRKSLGEAFIKDQPQLHQVVLGALSHGDGNPKVTWAPLFVKYFDMAYEKAMYGDVSPGAALSEAEKLLLADMKK